MTFKSDFTDPEVIGNYIEGVFWMTVGIVLGIAGRKTHAAYKKLSLFACAVFITFGISDLVRPKRALGGDLFGFWAGKDCASSA